MWLNPFWLKTFGSRATLASWCAKGPRAPPKRSLANILWETGFQSCGDEGRIVLGNMVCCRCEETNKFIKEKVIFDIASGVHVGIIEFHVGAGAF